MTFNCRRRRACFGCISVLFSNLFFVLFFCRQTAGQPSGMSMCVCVSVSVRVCASPRRRCISVTRSLAARSPAAPSLALFFLQCFLFAGCNTPDDQHDGGAIFSYPQWPLEVLQPRTTYGPKSIFSPIRAQYKIADRTAFDLKRVS